MTRDGAVDTGTPRDETVATPPTPAMTPQDSEPTVVNNTGMSGTKREGAVDSPRVGSNSVAKSIKESVRSGLQMLKDSMRDEHGEPVKEQERVSYQNMIVRYGDWSNVRGQVFAYFFLTFIMCIYRGHSVEIDSMLAVARVNEGRHMHCNCTTSKEQLSLNRIQDQFNMNNSTSVITSVALMLVGGLSSLWERFIGRRKFLYGIMAVTIPASVTFMFAEVSTLQQLSLAILTLCSMVLVLITISNLIEMLPYEIRYIAVSCYNFGVCITSAAATAHFRFGFSKFILGLCLAIANVAGIFLLKYYIKDSLCHLNIINDVATIEQIVQKEEYRLHVEKREGNRLYHEAIARKIFEDIVYLDQDELKLSEFFNRLYKNFAMLEIVLTFFQSISAGIHDNEFTRFTNERFFGPSWLSMDRMLGMAIAGMLMHFLRKAHRNRAICLLFAAALLNSIARNALIDFDKGNKCASIQFVDDNLIGLSIVLSTVGSALGYSLQMTIFLHFLEITPSVLRPTCILFIYLPIKMIRDFGGNILNYNVTKDLNVVALVYAYHLLIIILTMLRTLSRLPFSLYLFDLMPQPENEYGDNRKQQSGQMIEETALPVNFSAEMDKAGTSYK